MLAARREVGEQADGHAVRDEREADERVVRPVPEVGLEAAAVAAGADGHLVPAHPGRPARPRGVRERLERHRVRAGERMAGRECDAHRVHEQLVPFDALRARPRKGVPLVGEHEVEVAEREGGKRVLRLGLDELAAQFGGAAGEGGDRGRGDAERHGLERGDPPPPGDPAGRGGEVGLGDGGAVEQRRGMAHEHERRVGQPDTASGALEQGYPGLALEDGELLGDRGRRELEHISDRGDRPAGVELAEQTQATEVEHQATLPNIRYEKPLILKGGLRHDAGVRAGILLCLASAACFGAMGIFGRLAYDGGATVGTLLVVRFALAALLCWALLTVRGDLGAVRRIGRRDLLLALALGAAGYSAQAGAYFGALERIDPGLLGLLLYTFPAIVTVAAIRLGRERFSGRTAIALGCSSTGLVLVLAGAGAGALEPVGTALGLTAAVVYSVYILSSEGIAGRLDPFVLSALVCTGATVTLTVGALAGGGLHPGAVSAAGWGWLAAIAVVSTVAAVALFFAGLQRTGPTTASILSTFEPFVTVVLAGLAFGDALTAVQAAGGVLIVGGVVILNVRRIALPRRRAAALATGRP